MGRHRSQPRGANSHADSQPRRQRRSNAPAAASDGQKLCNQPRAMCYDPEVGCSRTKSRRSQGSSSGSLSSAAMSEPTKRRLAVMNRRLSEYTRGGEWFNGAARGCHESGGKNCRPDGHDVAFMRRSVSAGQVSHKVQRAIPGYQGYTPGVKSENLHAATYVDANRAAASKSCRERSMPTSMRQAGGGPHAPPEAGFVHDIAQLNKFEEHLRNRDEVAKSLMRELPQPWVLHSTPRLPRNPSLPAPELFHTYVGPSVHYSGAMTERDDPRKTGTTPKDTRGSVIGHLLPSPILGRAHKRQVAARGSEMIARNCHEVWPAQRETDARAAKKNCRKQTLTVDCAAKVMIKLKGSASRARAAVSARAPVKATATPPASAKAAAAPTKAEGAPAKTAAAQPKAVAAPTKAASAPSKATAAPTKAAAAPTKAAAAPTKAASVAPVAPVAAKAATKKPGQI